jgi:hypothetical protein
LSWRERDGVFLIGFGAVHLPAAFILLINRARHSGKS